MKYKPGDKVRMKAQLSTMWNHGDTKKFAGKIMTIRQDYSPWTAHVGYIMNEMPNNWWSETEIECLAEEDLGEFLCSLP